MEKSIKPITDFTSLRKLWDEKIKDHYWRDRKYRFGHPDMVMKYLRPELTDVLYEYGCGYGREAFSFSTLVEKVVGADISPTNVKEARSKAKADGNSRINFYLWPEEVENLPDSSFDCAYSYATFQHCEDVVATKALSDIRRLLKPSGRFLFQFGGGPEPDSVRGAFKGVYVDIARSPSEVGVMLETAQLTWEGLIRREVGKFIQYWVFGSREE